MTGGWVSYLLTQSEFLYLCYSMGAESVVGMDMKPDDSVKDASGQYSVWEKVIKGLEAKQIVKRNGETGLVVDVVVGKLIETCCKAESIWFVKSMGNENISNDAHYYISRDIIVKIQKDHMSRAGLLITPFRAIDEFMEDIDKLCAFDMEESLILREFDAQLNPEEMVRLIDGLASSNEAGIKELLVDDFEEDVIDEIITALCNDSEPITVALSHKKGVEVSIEREYLIYPLKGGVVEVYTHDVSTNRGLGFKVLSHKTLKIQLRDIVMHNRGEVYID